MGNIPTSNHREVETAVHVSMKNFNILSRGNDREQNLVVTSIEGMFNSLPALSSTEQCIYRVPNELRELNVNAYAPQVVSIGPFHRGEKRLQAMEEYKLRYLQAFLYRTEQRLEDCVEAVKTWEDRARHCYSQTIELSSDEFIKMILMDGSFIVELLLKNNIIFQPWMSKALFNDMRLLENQLPFFVLENLFNLIPESKRVENPSFLELTCEYFGMSQTNELLNTVPSSEIKHFVDFVHRCYQSSISHVKHSVDDRNRANARYDCPPTVTELHEAGIKFEKGTSCSLFDIKFTDGILKIPKLSISDSTESLFRNLIAFEQCHWTDKRIVSYLFLLDGMIDTSKDVDLLIREGIIVCNLGSSEDISALFNNICKHVVLFYPFYYSDLCKDLHAYCRRPWHKWKATLRRDYFNTPWKVLSLIVALVLLVLTSIQAVCSVISV